MTALAGWRHRFSAARSLAPWQPQSLLFKTPNSKTPDKIKMETTKYPRVTIQFCTQCKWLLRAAYYAQELLSTFSTSLGEVSLLPATGGVFVVEIHHQSPTQTPGEGLATVNKTVLWDRKTDGGFPETKELKKRVRDVIDPGRDLGHVDGKKKSITESVGSAPPKELVREVQQVNLACAPKGDNNGGCEDCG